LPDQEKDFECADAEPEESEAMEPIGLSGNGHAACEADGGENPGAQAIDDEPWEEAAPSEENAADSVDVPEDRDSSLR
jgi:hypothetical protein